MVVELSEVPPPPEERAMARAIRVNLGEGLLQILISEASPGPAMTCILSTTLGLRAGNGGAF